MSKCTTCGRTLLDEDAAEGNMCDECIQSLIRGDEATESW
jgi:DNA-directed RNA polymerase subunit RPC12/RpoP